MDILIKRQEYEKICRRAREVWPEEACGLVAGREDGDVRIIEEAYLLTNTDHTNEHFTIDPREQLLAIKEMRRKGQKALGNWHSHPETPSRPSEEDKRLANDKNASYLILSLMDKDAPVLNAFHIEKSGTEKTVRKETLTIIEGE